MNTANGHGRLPTAALADRRDDWIGDSLLSGFVATFAMTVVMAVAYTAASAFGAAEGAMMEGWMYNLSNNPLTSDVRGLVLVALLVNLAMGIIWALIYGRFVEPALDGPGWRKGALFSLIPWLLSLVVFFPIVGVGFFGSEVGAGPLPTIGNLILHLIYGVTLGAFYGIALETGLGGATGEREAAAAAERGAAIGVVAGAVVGAVLGWLVGPGLEDLAGRAVVTAGGAFTGAALGILVGSLIGTGENRQPSPGRLTEDRR